MSGTRVTIVLTEAERAAVMKVLTQAQGRDCTPVYRRGWDKIRSARVARWGRPYTSRAATPRPGDTGGAA